MHRAAFCVTSDLRAIFASSRWPNCAVLGPGDCGGTRELPREKYLLKSPVITRSFLSRKGLVLAIPKSYKGLKSQYDALDEDVRNFLSKLGPLLDDGKNYEIALAYCFMKLEEGHHRALKCGLVRIHDCDSATVDQELQKQHFTAEKYRSVFKNVFSKGIPSAAVENLNKAQKIRNNLIHGKATTDPKRREAVYHAIEYMNAVGAFVKDSSGKNPYGDLRGLAGKRKLLPAKSTIWMLKGFGLGDKSPLSIA